MFAHARADPRSFNRLCWCLIGLLVIGYAVNFTEDRERAALGLAQTRLVNFVVNAQQSGLEDRMERTSVALATMAI